MNPLLRRIKLSITLAILIVIAILTTSCGAPSNKPPLISSLEASHPYVYPRGKTEIQCVVSDPEGDDMSFKWSCADGSFSGNGPITTWQAPNSYGDYHIMVIARDSNNNSTQDTLTISVIANQSERKNCCGN